MVAFESIDPFITFLIVFFVLFFLSEAVDKQSYTVKLPGRPAFMFYSCCGVFLPVLNWQIDHYWTIGNQNRHSVLWHILRGISQSYNLNETYGDGDRKMSFHCAIMCVLLFVCITIKQAKPWYFIAKSTRKKAESSVLTTSHRKENHKEITLVLQLTAMRFYTPEISNVAPLDLPRQQNHALKIHFPCNL